MTIKTKFDIADIVYDKRHIERYKELEPMMIRGIYFYVFDRVETGIKADIDTSYRFYQNPSEISEKHLLNYEEAFEFLALVIKDVFKKANQEYKSQ